MEIEGYENNNILTPYNDEAETYIIPEHTLILDLYGPGSIALTTGDILLTFEEFE